MPKRKTRLYWRDRGGERRAYADFRDFADVGGVQEALREAGERHATSDPDVAARLLAERLESLELARRNQKAAGRRGRVQLTDYASRYLVAKAKADLVSDRWLASAELFLTRAGAFFGTTRELASIEVADMRRWADHLREQGMSGGTVRHHLNTLSNLFRHAVNDGLLRAGYNPVRDLLDKPKARQTEARWLEVPEAALFLESVRTYKPKRPDRAIPFLYPLVATFLLTGGRRAEVLGLEVDDVNFERRTVTFRPSQWRRLKTEGAARTVALAPQLEEILRAYLSERTAQEVLQNRPTRRLLFPVEGRNGEAMLTNFDDSLDGAAIRAGFWEYVLDARGEPVKDEEGQPKKRGTVRTKMFRHTWCSARLQTLDHGGPVSPDTVRREMGHRSPRLVEQIYGHLGAVRHRSEVVEYRVEQHEEKLRERLAGLSVTTNCDRDTQEPAEAS
ncbi:MAG: tyrosine-type recombinase/integrase [Gemmatimonadales bacterium]